jgi:hypothetical protein
MSQIMTRAYRYLIEAGAFNVPNPVIAKATAMRRLMDEGVRPDIAESAIRNAFNDTVRTNKPTPAIDWKPINKDELEPYKDYLLWSEEYSIPIAGYIDNTGSFTKLSTGAFLEDVTHYVDFNKPEGVD